MSKRHKAAQFDLELPGEPFALVGESFNVEVQMIGMLAAEQGLTVSELDLGLVSEASRVIERDVKRGWEL